MDHHQKRTLTFVTIGLIFVLSGIEYGKSVSAPLMISLEADLPGVPAASSRLGKQAPRLVPQLSSCPPSGGTCRSWRPRRTSWVWVCPPSA